MNDQDLRRIAALLESALNDFDAGEAYAHHARRPVAKALQIINQQPKEEPHGKRN